MKNSKFLSLVLRHKPELINLKLDNSGWVDVNLLLENAKKKGNHLDREELESIVANNDKKRFEFNADHSKIRASQGHSIKVDLGYKESIPPSILYHGTADRFIDSILEKGILRRNRHHVHLSSTQETAKEVGLRHGSVVIIHIDAQKMYDNGHRFYKSTNSVWLTNYVDPTYFLTIQKETERKQK
jgi:putative RNA 2'-phosphotransferase